MRKTLLSVTVVTAGLLSTDLALAACEKPRNAFDSVYCLSTEYAQVDRELNNEFGTLRKMLNDGQKAALKKSQIAWIKDRDAQCSYERDGGYFVNLQCAVDKTNERLAVLRERERECQSTGCVDAKL
ncbi:MULTISPECIES: lysozyme inhibitor LprI family protein [unclassified Pseudomonas]|uniref:lysozyme inhibitor LprI family protein n=1 Tax=unclassified Pseudomonas TaxID=196821 RepID=UPI001EFB2E59|nr:MULTISPECIES: lysozyme inhibitor LprI family protein [unclassified Pseudomonas]MCG8905717.1 lysozyme inhibitor LprI family protein [Pseudomonas sp. DP-17]MDU4252879.1 lysozyme inhibitor LprI family protein [Pseudomonas sp.]